MTAINRVGMPPATGQQSKSAQSWVQQRQNFAKILSNLHSGDTAGATQAFAKATGTSASSPRTQNAVNGLGNAMAASRGNNILGGEKPALFGKPNRAAAGRPQDAAALAARQAAAVAGGAAPAAQALTDVAP